MVAALKADPLGWYREHGLEPPSSVTRQAREAAPAAAPGCEMHACPMHPEVCQGSAGSCPRCGERLEPAAAPQAAQYTCPMHPEVVQSEPGRCPKCGMPLELRQAAHA